MRPVFGRNFLEKMNTIFRFMLTCFFEEELQCLGVAGETLVRGEQVRDMDR